VRWSGPLSSTVFHAAGVQETEAPVFGLEEMLLVEEAKVTGLSLASA